MSDKTHLARFGQKMKRARTRKAISQEALADRAGLHRTYISDIERGTRNVSLLNIQKIAKALRVKPSSLLE
jgi:transcriptional regulator with XRE-family HTH domain